MLIENNYKIGKLVFGFRDLTRQDLIEYSEEKNWCGRHLRAIKLFFCGKGLITLGNLKNLVEKHPLREEILEIPHLATLLKIHRVALQNIPKENPQVEPLKNRFLKQAEAREFFNPEPDIPDEIPGEKPLKNLEIDFSLIDRDKLKDLAKLHVEKELKFSFAKLPSIDFYKEIMLDENSAERLIDLFFDEPSQMIQILYDIPQKITEPVYARTTINLYEFYGKCLEKFVDKGGIEPALVKSLSDKEQRKLFISFLSSKHYNKEKAPIKKLGEVFVDEPAKLFSLVKTATEIFEKYHKKEISFDFIYSLVNAGVFDEAYIRGLSLEKQQVFKDFVIKVDVLQSINFLEGDVLKQRLFAGCMDLIYRVKHEPDEGVIILQDFQYRPWFANFFLSLNKEQLLLIEQDFKNFKDPNTHELLRIDPERLKQENLNEKMRLECCFLHTIINYLDTFNIAKEDFSQLREKINHLMNIFPWMTFEAIAELCMEKEYDAFLALVIANAILSGLETQKSTNEIRESVQRYWGLEESAVRLILPGLFLETTKEIQAEILTLFRGCPDMISLHLDFVLTSKDIEMKKHILRRFFEIHRELDIPLPGAFALFLPKIKEKEQLLLILNILKEQNLPDKDKLFAAISGGIIFKDFNNEDVYQPSLLTEDVVEAFEETGLADKFADPLINCVDF